MIFSLLQLVYIYYFNNDQSISGIKAFHFALFGCSANIFPAYCGRGYRLKLPCFLKTMQDHSCYTDTSKTRVNDALV
ncbi:hypothetical protein D770_24505 [Flammeovirgaceae bacterium 311]|nr:hypothetical protein D770_24505 [Flammeovirgaceae bacterium 311]